MPWFRGDNLLRRQARAGLQDGVEESAPWKRTPLAGEVVKLGCFHGGVSGDAQAVARVLVHNEHQQVRTRAACLSTHAARYCSCPQPDKASPLLRLRAVNLPV
jgi:hypothetical protein